MLSDLAPRELQVSQLEHYDGSTLRRDADSALFAIPLSLSRHRYSSKETLRAVLDARCIVDGSIQEAARWPTECQVRINSHSHVLVICKRARPIVRTKAINVVFFYLKIKGCYLKINLTIIIRICQEDIYAKNY